MAKKKAAPLAGDEIVGRDGLDALSEANRNKLNLDNLTVDHSVDIDTCFRTIEPNAARWDYYIGLRKHGAVYVEVHRISEDEIDKIVNKATWLKNKCADLAWPEEEGRPLFVAPTSGIGLGAARDLRRRLALKKITVVMKGDAIEKLL